MRRLFTAASSGLTSAELRWGVRTGRWRRAERGVYGEGSEPLDGVDAARARVLASHGVANGHLAGVLHGLDSVDLDGRVKRRRGVPAERVVVVAGVPCTDVLQTLVDLAGDVDDTTWEQALESALRMRAVTVAELERLVPSLGAARTRGTGRMRRVLAARPPGAPPTGSLLETLMVQLARDVRGLAAPVRQHEVRNIHGDFIARVDLCWPDLGLFLELDGQQHKDQPVYDARRETAVIAATGWLVGRFTWREVVDLPRTTARRLGALVEQARRRPLTV